LISASDDKTVKFWDADTGTSRGTLSGFEEATMRLAVSADSQSLAVIEHESGLRVYDLYGRTKTEQPPLPPDPSLPRVDPVPGKKAKDLILGRWEGLDKESPRFEFSPDGIVTITPPGAGALKAPYRFTGDNALEVDLPLPDGKKFTQKLKVEVSADSLITTDETNRVERFKRVSPPPSEPSATPFFSGMILRFAEPVGLSRTRARRPSRVSAITAAPATSSLERRRPATWPTSAPSCWHRSRC
jgi:hypothetical protein